MKALVIVGLPASGKSMYINSIENGATVIDDFISSKEIPYVDNLIIADPFLCKEHYRKNIFQKLMDMGYSVEFIFFENDPDQCLKNAKNRPEKEVSAFIKMLSREYQPPRVDKRVWHGKE